MTDTEHLNGDSAEPSKPINPEDPPAEGLLYALVLVIVMWLILMFVIGHQDGPQILHWLHTHFG